MQPQRKCIMRYKKSLFPNREALYSSEYKCFLSQWLHLSGPQKPLTRSPLYPCSGDRICGVPRSNLPLTPAYTIDTPNRRHTTALLCVPRRADVGRHIPSGHTKRHYTGTRGDCSRHGASRRRHPAERLSSAEPLQTSGPGQEKSSPAPSAQLLTGHCLGNKQTHSSALSSATGATTIAVTSKDK